MTEQTPRPIEYQRPRSAKHGLFAGRFIAFASVGLALGAGSGLTHLAMFAALAEMGTSVAYTIAAEPIVRLLLDVLLMAGCLGTVISFPWARRVMLIALGFLLFAAILDLSRVLFGGMADQLRIAPWTVVIAAGVRAIWIVYASIGIKLYSGMYADFYFSRPQDGTAGASAERTPLTPVAIIPRVPTFVLSGTDITTKQAVAIQSHAKTEALARQSAVMLGIDPATLIVRPVNDGRLPTGAPQAAEEDA